jgi:hypothetical protein
MHPEGLSPWKITIISSGNEPTTFQLVTQCQRTDLPFAKVKLNLTQRMSCKSHGDSGKQAPFILSLGAGWIWDVIFIQAALLPSQESNQDSSVVQPAAWSLYTLRSIRTVFSRKWNEVQFYGTERQLINFFFIFYISLTVHLLIILANNQLDTLLHVFIYFTSLHVSSITVLIIRRSNCINTSSGMIRLCKWLLGIPSSHLHSLIIPDDVLTFRHRASYI